MYNWCFKTSGICNDGEYWGAIPRLLVFAEQQALYNAINWMDIPYGCRNSTVAGAGITMLWCPSDGTIAGLRFYEACAGWDGTTVPLTYCDYATMAGTYIPNNGKFPPTLALLNAENGVYPEAGTPTYINPGSPGTRGPITIASVTDGTSNTVAFAEIAHGKFETIGCTTAGCCDWEGCGWWADSGFADSTISSYYPPNIPINPLYYTTGVWQSPDGCDSRTGNIPTFTSMSFHPGGVNCGFADGSVHFIKSSISSWNSLAIQRINSPACTVPPGVQQGVWQSLSTINGGEVISSDQY